MLVTQRPESLFAPDIHAQRGALADLLDGQRVLVIGGAGSIGASTVRQLSRFRLAALHVIDHNENALTELARDLRSRDPAPGLRHTRLLPLDFGSTSMRRFLADEAPYDRVLNFAAVKHVRSEKDSYSLLQMLETNVLKAARLLDWLRERGGTRAYFTVSTDKAANPVNLMGATKRLMEHVTFCHPAHEDIATVSSARFANVAFSSGSLLEGWLHRLQRRQPLSVPKDTRRFFVSLDEAGQLCLLASTCAPPRHLLVPRANSLALRDLLDIACAFLRHAGYTPSLHEDPDRARAAVATEMAEGRYPLLVTPLDTTGEKSFEEFLGDGEASVEIGLTKLVAVQPTPADAGALTALLGWLERIAAGQGATPTKDDIIATIRSVVPELRHVETHKYLDDRM